MLILGLVVPIAQADTAPDAPTITQKKPLGSDFLDITFRNPSTYGFMISGYDIWTSDDGGINFPGHFTAPAPTDPSALVYLRIPSSSAVARFVKVRLNTSAGPGSWSAPVLMYTNGARAMRVYVQAPDGTPIIGGSITWTMPTTPSGGSAH